MSRLRSFRRARSPRHALAAGEREGHLRAALAAVVAGDPDTAEGHLHELLRADSTDVELYFVLGRLMRERGEIGRAIRVHQNLLLRADVGGTQRTRALIALGEDLLAGGFAERATASFQEAVERAHRSGEAWDGLARSLAALGRHEAAVNARRRAARHGAGPTGAALEREVSALWVEAARDAHARGRDDQARRALKRAERADARNADVHLLRGTLEAERGRNKAALAAWRAVPAADRGRAVEAYPRLASAYAAAGRVGEFERFLRDQIARDEQDLDARLALARALGGRGALDEALAELKEILTREPERRDARAELVKLLLSGGRESEAIDQLRELVSLWEGQAR